MLVDMYTIIYFFISCMLLICSKNIRRYEKKLGKETLFDRETFFSFFREVITDKTIFETGKYYAYNPINKKIIVPLKNIYNCYDVFGMWHEIGHWLDDKNKLLYYNSMSILIYRLVFIPLYVVTFGVQDKGVFIRGKMMILLIICSIYRIFFIFKFEISASKYAINRMHFEKKVTKLAYMCIYQQCLWTIFQVMTFGFVDMVYKFFVG